MEQIGDGGEVARDNRVVIILDSSRKARKAKMMKVHHFTISGVGSGWGSGGGDGKALDVGAPHIFWHNLKM